MPKHITYKKITNTVPLASADEYSLLHGTVGLNGSDIRYPLACNENKPSDLASIGHKIGLKVNSAQKHANNIYTKHCNACEPDLM